MPSIRVVNDFARIDAGYSWKNTIKAEAPGRIWFPGARSWCAPVTHELVAFGRRHHFHIDEVCETLHRWAEKARHYQPHPKLLPYQVEGVRHLIGRRRAILADEPGLGKTVQSLLATNEMGSHYFPCLVVCPAALQENWKREIEKWLPGAGVAVCRTTDPEQWLDDDGNLPYELREADFYIVGYPIIHAWADFLLERVNIMSLIADEAHALKTPSARSTRTVAKIVRQGLLSVQLLTGTPILNRPVELMSLLRLIGALEAFGGREDYILRYCNPMYITVDGTKKMIPNGASNLDELHERVQSSGMLLRRRKAEVLDQLPSKTVHYLPIRLPESQRPKPTEGGVNVQDSVEYRQAVGWAKLEFAKAWIQAFLEGADRPLVVFVWHRLLAETLSQHFDSPLIYGGTTHKQRQRIVDDFQCGRTPLLVGNMQSLGEGLTLTAASDVLLAELPWTPAMATQAIDRVHRISQDNPVTATILVAEDTYDEDIVAILERKQDIVDEAVDGVQTDIIAKLFD